MSIWNCTYIMYCFLYNDKATTEIYTLSLHDALPILDRQQVRVVDRHDLRVGRGFVPVVVQRRLFRDILRLMDIVRGHHGVDRKSTRLNSSHVKISYAVFCLKKKIKNKTDTLIIACTD